MLKKNSLVLYKNRPAKIHQIGDKVEIELDSGKTVKVRPKDVTLLHPGPVDSPAALSGPPGEIETAWELLAGETTTLPDLAELIFDEFSPQTAWATWQLVDDGLYFCGEPDAIEVRVPEDVKTTRADRAAKTAEKQARSDFLARVTAGKYDPADEKYLTDVESLAGGLQDKSWVLNALGQAQSRENAHALLLSLGYWTETTNPYPQRMGVPTTPPELDLPPLPDESRLDLTHLPAFAIDDAGSNDPDDAISLDGDTLWVHVADVAALVPSDSPADLEARARGASLYLPEGTVTMLPLQATQTLALGLAEVSPALSFKLNVKTDGPVSLEGVTPSWVRVQRLSYEEAELQLEAEPFNRLLALSNNFTARRQDAGAIELNLPEVKVRVEAGRVSIKPLPSLKSRDIVRDAMLMTGEAVARFALERDIPLMFSTQDAPDDGDFPKSMSGMFARRRTLKRSQLRSTPAPHAGLGLEYYAQTTSPLRRYADLVIHQQLRAYLRSEPLLSEAEMIERVGAAEAIAGSVRQTERLANKHWTLVYLMQHLGWHGEGVLVEDQGRKSRVLLPELDLEIQIRLKQDLPPDSIIPLRFKSANLPLLEAYFQVHEQRA
jgi:exoribonuclease-2